MHELVVSMLTVLSKEGLFKNDSVWFTAYYVYNTVWNLSDASLLCAQCLGEAGMVKLCAANIAHGPYRENMKQKNVAFLIKASLSILHNLSKAPSNRHFYRQEAVEAKIQPYAQGCDDNDNDAYLKAITMMTLAYILDEEEDRVDSGDTSIKENGETINMTTEKSTVEYIIGLLKDAQQSTDRRSQGLSCAELAQGLGRLAVNDHNKSRILQAGALPLLTSMLQQDGLLEEQEAATQAIWNLAFDSTVRQHLAVDKACVEALEKLTHSKEQSIRTAAKGALWVGQKQSRSTRTSVASSSVASSSTSGGSSRGPSRSWSRGSSTGSGQLPHIMLSYQWAAQKVVLKVRDLLVTAGYRVWVDVDCMYGSTLQSMAEAVENAEVILVCISERYKESPNCRTEAEYAYQCRKSIIPLMMDKYYQPNGWLGMIMGTKYYVDLSGRHSFSDQAQKLLREISDIGSAALLEEPVFEFEDASTTMLNNPRNHTVSPRPQTLQSPRQSTSSPRRHVSTPRHQMPSPLPESPSPTQPAHVREWSKENVQQWLEHANLSHLRKSLKDFDGSLLAQLHTLRQEAPDFFYTSLRQDLCIQHLVDILKLTAAMDKIL
ncbi:uncharacterized protein LOC119746126 isoform X2 [Patiria miniata]|uniref:TIR domain-containing protein n=1 Tax=Patiria miniata TaxID=46514 RepID=A0A914BRD4_PATMI|nr:uncharacterized protein LOC119746126 isoform X2 [Patiria miniata]